VEVIEGYRIGAEGINVDLVHRWLAEDSYWAAGRSRDTVARSLANSYCLAAFSDSGEQVGFARSVTDWATFGWIADVYVPWRLRGARLRPRRVPGPLDGDRQAVTPVTGKEPVTRPPLTVRA
jgi:hypothetical protein